MANHIRSKQEASKSASKDASKSPSKDASKSASKDASKSASKAASKSASKDASNSASKDTSKSASKETASVSRKVMNTIRELQGRNGIALREVKKFLKEEKKMDVKGASESIKLAIKRNMEKGILVREDGLYKAKQPQAPAKRPARQAKASDQVPTKAGKVAKRASPVRTEKAVVKRPRLSKAKCPSAETPETPTEKAVVKRPRLSKTERQVVETSESPVSECPASSGPMEESSL